MKKHLNALYERARNFFSPHDDKKTDPLVEFGVRMLLSDCVTYNQFLYHLDRRIKDTKKFELAKSRLDELILPFGDRQSSLIDKSVLDSLEAYANESDRPMAPDYQSAFNKEDFKVKAVYR